MYRFVAALVVFSEFSVFSVAHFLGALAQSWHLVGRHIARRGDGIIRCILKKVRMSPFLPP